MGPRRSRTTRSNMLESDDEVSDEEDSEPSSSSNDLNTDADPTSDADNMVPVEPFSVRVFPPAIDEVKVKNSFRAEADELAKQEEGEFSGRECPTLRKRKVNLALLKLDELVVQHFHRARAVNQCGPLTV